MATYDQDSDVIRWGLSLLDGDPPLYSGYYGETIESGNNYQEQYIEDRYDITDSNHVENDEIIARTLQEDFSQLAVSEASGYSVAAEEHMQPSVQPHDWQCPPACNHYSNHEYRLEETDDTVPSTSCSSPGNAEEYLHSPEYSDDNELDDEVGKTLNQMIPIPHVPRINGEIPSIDEAVSDHDRLINRLQLFGFVEHKVEGDGNCQFRALADQIYHSPEHHKTVRRHVVNQLKSQPDNYEGYVPMEYGDYLRNMSKNGEWGDHVTLQAAADSYGVKVVVMTSFKDTCYIEILPVIQKTKEVIFLSFWAEVHYNSIYFEVGNVVFFALHLLYGQRGKLETVWASELPGLIVILIYHRWCNSRDAPSSLTSVPAPPVLGKKTVEEKHLTEEIHLSLHLIQILHLGSLEERKSGGILGTSTREDWLYCNGFLHILLLLRLLYNRRNAASLVPDILVFYFPVKLSPALVVCAHCKHPCLNFWLFLINEILFFNLYWNCWASNEE